MRPDPSPATPPALRRWTRRTVSRRPANVESAGGEVIGGGRDNGRVPRGLVICAVSGPDRWWGYCVGVTALWCGSFRILAAGHIAWLQPLLVGHNAIMPASSAGGIVQSTASKTAAPWVTRRRLYNLRISRVHMLPGCLNREGGQARPWRMA